ncbi:MAG: hypothetical protein RUMPE_01105 [Eubacteriales bacterium SKADARSKE-1]|nr:hypothetical protein [Eubacteriales bacterium SKADARSKE-1]
MKKILASGLVSIIIFSTIGGFSCSANAENNTCPNTMYLSDFITFNEKLINVKDYCPKQPNILIENDPATSFNKIEVNKTSNVKSSEIFWSKIPLWLKVWGAWVAFCNFLLAII